MNTVSDKMARAWEMALVRRKLVSAGATMDEMMNIQGRRTDRQMILSMIRCGRQWPQAELRSYRLRAKAAAAHHALQK